MEATRDKLARPVSPETDLGKVGNLLDKLGRVDVESSATLDLFRTDKELFSQVMRSFDGSLPAERTRMLDMGCGYGALSEVIGGILQFREVYGVDVNSERGKVARQRGVGVSICNLDEEPLPFPSNHFELVTTFGVLDHLRSLDPISEAYRVLKSGGCFALSIPNLGSWMNRLALFAGYQPRNLEISRKGLFGVHKAYKQLYTCTEPMGRITGVTLRAMEDFLRSNGFQVLRRWGARLVPAPDRALSLPLKMLDRLLSKRPSLAVRYVVLSRKT